MYYVELSEVGRFIPALEFDVAERLTLVANVNMKLSLLSVKYGTRHFEAGEQMDSQSYELSKCVLNTTTEFNLPYS